VLRLRTGFRRRKLFGIQADGQDGEFRCGPGEAVALWVFVVHDGVRCKVYNRWYGVWAWSVEHRAWGFLPITGRSICDLFFSSYLHPLNNHPTDRMKTAVKSLIFFVPLLLLLSCGIINTTEDIDYDWYGEWKRTDIDSENYMVMTADTMFVFENPLASDEWVNCDDNKIKYPIINKSEVSITISYNNDPLYVGIESFSEDLNSLILRFEGESETESYQRSELPGNCSY